MNKDIKVSVSILSADFARLGDEIKKCEDAGVDIIHIDVMDGHFVPNITIGPVIIESVKPYTKIPLDAHLMIENPDMYIETFTKSGADIITVHAECYGELKPFSKGRNKFPKEIEKINPEKVRKDLNKIKKSGAKAAIALNPGTPLCIQDVLNDVDMVLIMSVNPGFAGQAFMDSVLPKIEALRKIYKGDIAVDGGINNETAKKAVQAGANILATASFFFKSKDPKETIKSLKRLKG